MSRPRIAPTNEADRDNRRAAPHEVLQDLVALVDPPLAEAAERVRITGTDPVVGSPHRIGAAIAAAIAAQATGVATLWRMATGRAQDVAVDLDQAVHALNPGRHLRQSGYPLQGFTPKEPGTGYFRARDGRFVYLVCSRPALRNGLLDVLGCANSVTAIAAAVARRDAADLEAEAHAHRLPLTMARSRDEWQAHAQGRVLAGLPVVEITRIRPGQPFLPPPKPRALAGIRVLDLSHILAGPGLARCLAEQGADVLRIVPPRQGDPVNFMIETGFGKRTAFLDLDSATDASRLRELTKDADVIVQSYRPGGLERRGFGPLDITSARGTIYVSVSCFGAAGPWTDRVGFDTNAQSATGIGVSEGSHLQPMLPPTHLFADYLTAYLGAFGAVAGLVRRAREGGSFHVRVSLARTCMWVQDLGYIERAVPLRALSPPRVGQMSSAFGELGFLEPVARYSETPAGWCSPPVPFGASPPEWRATD